MMRARTPFAAKWLASLGGLALTAGALVAAPTATAQPALCDPFVDPVVDPSVPTARTSSASTLVTETSRPRSLTPI